MKNNMFEYKRFYGSVEYSAEDKCLFGEIMGISDLVTFEGGSVQELEKAFHMMADEYIMDCKEIGKNPYKKYEGSFNVIIPPELHREADFVANRKGISLNDFVRKAITDELYTN